MVRTIKVSDDELTTRAMRAYFVAARKAGGVAPFPANDSGVEKIARKRYVVLRNVRGVLAVYRVRNDGVLKRLKRWPAAFEE